MIKSLEKSHFRYSKCEGGELHTGELLNLVCVDEKCDHRGLICPVCKMQSHGQCHVLPVKVFLGQVRDMVGSSNDPEELNNLGAYLRTLDATKKELLSILKTQISLLADLYKDLQVKVESTYFALRHNVLIQSTLSTKLPTLLEDLLNGADSLTLQRQFDKYCELIKYRDGKPKVTDKASTLVEHYKGLPLKISSIMSGSMTDYRNKLQEVCQKIDTEQNSAQIVKQVEEAKAHTFIFSSELKSQYVSLNADKNEAEMMEDVDQGYVGLEHTFNKEYPEVNLEILSLGQDNLCNIYLAREAHIKDLCQGLKIFQDEKEKALAYVGSDGTSSLPFNQDESQEEPMFFFGASQKVKVFLDFQTNTLVLTNSELPDQPLRLPIKQTINENEAKLCLILAYKDKVRILAPAAA